MTKNGREKPDKTTVFDQKAIKAQIIREAKAVGISTMTAETVAEKIMISVEKWVADKPVITASDLDREIARAAKRYSKDLAYVYENHGKII